MTAYLIDRMVDSWSPQDEYDLQPRRDGYPNEDYFNTQFGTRLVINHPEKARNAYRLGIISRVRYEKSMSSFSIKPSEKQRVIQEIEEFIAEVGFITELSKSNYSDEARNPQIVNPPSYYQKRFEHLDEPQKWEYLKAFSREGTGRLVLKYLSIRMQEIMLGLIQNYDSMDLSLLEKENAFFCRKYNEGFEEFEGYAIVSEFLNYLKALDDEGRCERMCILRELDDADPRSGNLSITLSPGMVDYGGLRKRVSVDDDYVEFAMMPLDGFEKYQNTGRICSDYHRAWNKDLMALHTFHNSAVGRRREEVDNVRYFSHI